jgi:pimeloyl-ACP methyl ester carboxylesterase
MNGSAVLRSVLTVFLAVVVLFAWVARALSPLSTVCASSGWMGTSGETFPMTQASQPLHPLWKGAYQNDADSRFTLDYGMISDEPITISLQSPGDAVTTMDNMPDFKFIATDPNQLTFSCSLWLQNTTSSKVYATKNGAVNGSLTTLTPSSPVPNGVWGWWINCTDDTVSGVSEKRSIIISVLRGDKAFTSSHDGSLRYYWLDLPDNFDNSAPTPLVFFLHGYGGSRLSYSQKYPVLRQVFQNHTWIVAAVDCRTTDGYQNWYAEPSRRDIADVLNILKSDYRIDSDHVHIMGNSMGGSGALKYAMFNNQVIASLVDVHGVANFTQFYYETSDATYKASLEASYGGKPSQVPAVYANESALGNERRFSHTPVMILHGTADATVSVSQSRNLNQSLSTFGYTVKYIEVPGVGHDAQSLISGREMEIFNWLNSHPLRLPVYLLLTADLAQGPYVVGHSITFTVNVFNKSDPAVGSGLILTVTGPDNYGYFDVQPLSVPADGIGEYSFTWIVPAVSGTYVVEVSLVPPQLTAYDAVWLQVV